MTLVFTLFLLNPIFAFGCVPTKTYMKVDKNQVAVFEIMFWSDIEEEIRFDYKSDKELDVTVIPNPLLLNPLKKDGEFRIGDKVYNITKVKLLVFSKKPGKYEIYLTAYKEIQPRGINVVDERTFRFVLEVDGGKKEVNEAETVERKEEASNINSDLSENLSKNILPIVFIIVILIISFLVYRFS